MEAAAVWSLFPGEIAADLRRVYGVRIADWHQQRMSSYEFLELVEYLPDDSLYKSGLRGGLCERDQAILQTANETAVLRAGMVPGADSDSYGARLFIPRHVLEEAARNEEESEEGREAVFGATRTDGES
jgi:hypothetical protein